MKNKNENQPELKSKEQMAKEMSARAAELVDIRGRNLVEIGIICLKMSQDPELPKLAGATNHASWMKGCFGKKKKLAERCLQIVKNLLGVVNEGELLDMGQVKAFELSRLTESERRKTEWIDAAKTMDTATFKQKVKDHLENRPDHKEKFVTITVKAPKSFRDETYKRVLQKGMLAEETEDAWMVLEAAFAEYEQSLNLSEEEQEVAESKEVEV